MKERTEKIEQKKVERIDISEKIKGLLLQNFTIGEVASILKIDKLEVERVSQEISERPMPEKSTDYYNELQKNLHKLVLTEMNKDGRDSNVILNAIKLQADIQEKKLVLNKTMKSTEKISKDYIYERDEKMYEAFTQGMSQPEIAKKFDVSNLTVASAIDRCELNLPPQLKTLSPTIIAETFIKGMDKEQRMKLLWNAYNNGLTRAQVRTQVNELKNEVRKH